MKTREGRGKGQAHKYFGLEQPLAIINITSGCRCGSFLGHQSGMSRCLRVGGTTNAADVQAEQVHFVSACSRAPVDASRCWLQRGSR